MNVTFRPATPDDARAVYDVFTQTTADIERRMGSIEREQMWLDPAFLARYWENRQPLFAHLTRTADQFWVAELNGRIIGYARATIHDGVRELLEYFVHPDHQSSGVGRELLARTFPAEGARCRAIIATTDIRAFARYLKSGVYPRFPIYYISRKPERVEVETDLRFVPATATPETLAALRTIDYEILGFERDADHEFLLGDRQGYLCYRGDQLVGYSYFGNGTGPIAMLDEADFPAVLARGETEAAERNEDEFGMNVPMINRAAVDYLLGRGFQLEDFTVLFMTDVPFGKFDQYIISSPAFFM